MCFITGVRKLESSRVIEIRALVWRKECWIFLLCVFLTLFSHSQEVSITAQSLSQLRARGHHFPHPSSTVNNIVYHMKHRSRYTHRERHHIYCSMRTVTEAKVSALYLWHLHLICAVGRVSGQTGLNVFSCLSLSRVSCLTSVFTQRPMFYTKEYLSFFHVCFTICVSSSLMMECCIVVTSVNSLQSQRVTVLIVTCMNMNADLIFTEKGNDDDNTLMKSVAVFKSSHSSSMHTHHTADLSSSHDHISYL